jgi:hypothetical protein
MSSSGKSAFTGGRKKIRLHRESLQSLIESIHHILHWLKALYAAVSKLNVLKKPTQRAILRLTSRLWTSVNLHAVS